MAAGSKRRWLVLAVLAGAGAWFVRSRMAGPSGLTGPVRVLPADPAPAGTTPTTAVVPGEPVAAGDVTAPAPSAVRGPWPASPASPAAPTSPVAPTPAASAEPEPEPEPPVAPGTAATPEPAEAAGEVAAPVPDRGLRPSPRPSPVRRAAKPEPSNLRSPNRRSPDPEPMPSGQALFAPPAAEATSGASPLPDGAAPGPEYTIKGNADSMLFHTPDSPYYKRTKAEVWFREADEARAAGFTEWTPKKRATQ